MSDDLLTRLRGYNPHDATARALLDEAAAEIERMAMDDDLREALAAYAHDAWAAYMNYHLSKCERGDGSFAIPYDYWRALRHQIIRPYAELSDEEREWDRKEADKMLAIVAPALAAAKQRAEAAERELERVRVQIGA